MKSGDYILRAFGLKLGLPDLEFDSYRMCQLKVEGLRLAIYDNRVKSCLTLFCEMTSPAMNDQELVAWHKLLFGAQFDFVHEETVVIGLNPTSDAMVAMSHIADEHVSLSLLSEKMNALVDWVLNCSCQFAAQSMSVPTTLKPSSYQTDVRFSGVKYA